LLAVTELFVPVLDDSNHGRGFFAINLCFRGQDELFAVRGDVVDDVAERTRRD